MLTTDEKLQLGKLLDKHRILHIYYSAYLDAYLIRHLNQQDEEVPEAIRGNDLD